MDRVVFLIEATGERIACLLNPESLTFSRQAGLRTRMARGGTILGAAGADDPLIVTGGGVTEVELQLLFDTDLAQSLDPAASFSAPVTPPVPAGQSAGGEAPLPALPPPDPDVRDLTRPLWSLAEPSRASGAATEAPVVRFIWGRAWNLPAVVTAAAERLERFSLGGMPQRSWLTLRLRRVPDTQPPSPDRFEPAPTLPGPGDYPLPGAGGETDAAYVEVIADADGNVATPLYQIANDHLGSPAGWSAIAAASGIEDPLRIEAGTVLTIPAAGTATASAGGSA
ncbi:hypothetical protein OU426_01645 [Frigidibacter sp. RF13]|uniref:CIS tube protein n=1 Tax=Frigidibacter sp. RF13 TaxID=2997340 RepID=UPI00226D8D3F|nr:hypothetical protein [Frigidibacter sp. RF13]MCY1125544.1 hypothetical protein [Frigidibacter sp. RF13]